MKAELRDILPADIFNDLAFNCRNIITDESVESLASDILAHTLIFPVTVQPMDEVHPTLQNPDYQWRILAGYRRFRAVTEVLRWKYVPCMIKYGLSDEVARSINLAENIERKDITPVEVGRAIRKQFPSIGVEKIGKLLKRPKSWVHRRVQLLTLPGEILDAIESGRITHQDGLDIVRFKTRGEQLEAFQAILTSRRAGRPRPPKMQGKLIRKTRYRTNKQTKAVIAALLEHGPASGVPDNVIEAAGKALLWSMHQLPTQTLLDHLNLPLKGDDFE